MNAGSVRVIFTTGSLAENATFYAARLARHIMKCGPLFVFFSGCVHNDRPLFGCGDRAPYLKNIFLAPSIFFDRPGV